MDSSGHVEGTLQTNWICKRIDIAGKADEVYLSKKIYQEASIETSQIPCILIKLYF